MKALVLPLALALLAAGCATPAADLGKSNTAALAPRVGLTEDLFTVGDFLPLDFPSFDGVSIHVDVQLPNGSGPFPVLVEYTPYSNTLSPTDEAWALGRMLGADPLPNALAAFYVPKGYAVAVAHVRGSGQSGGCFTTGGPEEAQDGYALVEFLADQPWSSGRVALMGTSYVGTTPISTATTDPPHLTTIVPVSAVSEWYRYYMENGEPRFFGELPFGVVYTDQPIWAATGFMPKPRNPTGYDPQSAQCGLAQMQTAYAQDDYNEYWKARDYVKDLGNATAPMLYAHGFLDENTPTSLVTDFFAAYPAEKRLWMQQHGHGVPASFERYHEYVHAWLDHFMLDRDNGALDLPPVVLQDSRGQYHVESDYPPRNASLALLHLGDGTLSWGPPEDSTLSYMDEPRSMDEFVGPREGAFLQFDSAPLDADLHVTGAPRIELVASSDKADTQWDVLLYDVDPAGSASFVTRGYMDARHGGDLAKGRDLTPGEERLYSWEMHGRDHHVAKGHVLRLIVVSTEEYVMPDVPGATNTIRIGADGSRLLLPVLPDARFTNEAPSLFGA
ncbi:MAG TPA: CocE/NonD family hydrolase [Candidatus Thermoplasmatota archaeon]|nr:CocE/NonD family hydrolase [Candidatus Thermoplasmatota archaeon]